MRTTLLFALMFVLLLGSLPFAGVGLLYCGYLPTPKDVSIVHFPDQGGVSYSDPPPRTK
jgi:hypothetical protein